MNGQEFYNEFKDALDYLGVGFRGMGDATVTIRDSNIHMKANGREAIVSIPLELKPCTT